MAFFVKNIINGNLLLTIMLCVSILLLLSNGIAYYIYKTFKDQYHIKPNINIIQIDNIILSVRGHI